MEIDPDYSFDQFPAHKPDEDSSRDLEIGGETVIITTIFFYVFVSDL